MQTTSVRKFDYWKKLYDNNKLEEFNFNDSGLLWLKIKSIVRKELLIDFLQENKIGFTGKSLNERFIELYELMNKDICCKSHQRLDDFIRNKNKEQLKNLDVKKLVSELYKLKYFDWGGDYKNALDKYLVDSYVKVYQSYDDLVSKFDNEISRAVQGYVLCSWYNNWSSILIEHIFKTHPGVLSAVGKIKKVDFFINNIPFDLKVTYLPANFIDAKRKEKGLKPELTELKQKARQSQISFVKHDKANDTYYEIVEKMKDRNDKICKETLQNIKKIRLEILNEARQNPKTLIQNLYEEQGEMRFDSANRLFLILINTEDFDNSWKLKRNLDLLAPAIKNYLDNFSGKKIDDLKINFQYGERHFTAYSDIIFVTK